MRDLDWCTQFYIVLVSLVLHTFPFLCLLFHAFHFLRFTLFCCNFSSYTFPLPRGPITEHIRLFIV